MGGSTSRACPGLGSHGVPRPHTKVTEPPGQEASPVEAASGPLVPVALSSGQPGWGLGTPPLMVSPISAFQSSVLTATKPSSSAGRKGYCQLGVQPVDKEGFKVLLKKNLHLEAGSCLTYLLLPRQLHQRSVS